MAELRLFCAWLFRWLVAKPVRIFFRTLRLELRRRVTRRPRDGED